MASTFSVSVDTSSAKDEHHHQHEQQKLEDQKSNIHPKKRKADASSKTTKRDQSEPPKSGLVSSASKNTSDNSRVRKKKKKKALQQNENLLAAAKDSVFTNSVVCDNFPKSSSIDDSHSEATNGNEESQQQFAQPQNIKVITTVNLPTKKERRRCAMESPLHTVIIHVQPLLILDINGILCHRIRKHKEPVGIISYRAATEYLANTPIVPRTNLKEFLAYLNEHFCLAVWTSAQPKTAKRLVKALFPISIANNLLFCWGQNRCNAVHDNKDNNNNNQAAEVVFEKQLDKVWNEFPMWNQFNTLLIDDSPDKCSSFRHNALHPPPLNGQSEPPIPDAAEVSKRHGLKQIKQWISDEENARLQQVFFDKLVDFWKSHKSETIWSEQGEVQCNRESESIWKFMENNATEHMGWTN